MSQILYHYGSNRRCFGILKDGAFRMSDIRKSNDFNELLLLYPQLLKEILKQYETAPFHFEYEGLEGTEAISALVTLAKELTDEALESGEFSNFVTCFSENPDMLSQWRGYANDGKGCCLGFSFDELKNYCEHSKGILRLEKVQYVTEKEISMLTVQFAKGILFELKGLREWITEKMTHDETGRDTDGLLAFNFQGMVESLLTDSLIYKSAGFSEEKEWRLFLSVQAFKMPDWVLGEQQKMYGPTGFSETLDFLRGNIQFNISEDNLSPYLPIHLNAFQMNPLREIWLGPKSKISRGDLELFLAQHSCQTVKIFESSIPYR